MSEQTNSTQDPKVIAIIAHITIVGWIIALIMNNRDKSEFAAFYIRQVLGIMLLGIAIQIAVSILSAIIPFFSILNIVQIGTIILWILSLIGAINETKSETPIIGHLFQDWFKNIK